MFLLFLLLGVLPQVVFCTLKLSFSNATECEPVFASFHGQLNSSLQNDPLSLQILPFNSTSTVVPLPSYATNSLGVNITFLPLPANTQFIATLNDPSGDSVSFVSDIFEIGAASPANTACLSHTSFTPLYQIENSANVSQCEDFTISYPKGSPPPAVELFNPRGFSYPLKLVSSTNTTATYTMVAIRQTQVMLMMSSGAGGQNQTSPLLTVQGDAFSPSNCFPMLSANGTSQSTSSTPSKKSPGISKGTIIGLSVGLGVTFVMAIPMAWFVIRERRRRRRHIAQRFDFDANRMERPPSPYIPEVKERPAAPPPIFFGYPGYTESGYVKDPKYVSEKYSPTISDYPRTSISWEYIPRASSDEQRRNMESDLRASVQMNMLSSSNIEKMLSRASVDGLAMHSPRSTRSRDSYAFPQSLPLTPPPALHLGYRQSPDVPHNPSFFADSAFTVDQPIPLSESPESMGSRLRPDSGTISPSSAGAMEDYQIVQPRRVTLQQARSVSPRTLSLEHSMAKLERGPRRTESSSSRFSMDSSVTGGLENRF